MINETEIEIYDDCYKNTKETDLEETLRDIEALTKEYLLRKGKDSIKTS